jgi:hypothetical protein
MKRFATIALFLSVAGAAPLRVQLDAHAGCPDAEAYWRAVTSRSSRITRGDDGHRASIAVTRQGSKSVGVLAIDDAAPRKVSADTCEEVVEALAFMTVLALDPEAVVPAPALPSPVPSSAPPITRPLVLPPPRVTPLPKRPTAPSWDLHVTTGASVFGAGPSPVFAIPIGIDASRERWSFGLAFTRSTSLVVEHPRGPVATFVWTSLRAHGCLTVVGTSVRWLGCVGLEGGAIEGRPRAVAAAHDVVRPWLTPLVTTQLEWRAAEALAFVLDAGLGVPLVRDEFVVEPDYFFYRAPRFIARGAFGLKVRFL